MSEDTSTSELVDCLELIMQDYRISHERCKLICEVQEILVNAQEEAGREKSDLMRMVSLREYVEKRQWRYTKHYKNANDRGLEQRAETYKYVIDELEEVLKRIPKANAN